MAETRKSEASLQTVAGQDGAIVPATHKDVFEIVSDDIDSLYEIIRSSEDEEEIDRASKRLRGLNMGTRLKTHLIEFKQKQLARGDE